MKKPASQVILEFLSIFPIGIDYWLARILAFIAIHTPNSISGPTERNIQLCLADLPASRQQYLGRTSIRHTSYSLFELAAVWCWPAHKILSRVTSEKVCEEFNQSSKGRLIIAPHIGSWELLGIRIANNNDLFSLYKPHKNPKIDAFVRQARSRNGAQLVPTDPSGLRKLMKGLKRGATVIILPDQKPHHGSAFVDSTYFGQAASTTPLIKHICDRVECDVFIGAMYREENSITFNLSIDTLDYGRLTAAESDSAQYLNDAIEAMVRSHPDQYQWSYKRFNPTVYDSL
ncbi:MAG: lysophospholipid acyltransferase family protein [Gammaproteobacteria bacterium]